MAAAVVQVSSCSPSQRRAVTSKGLAPQQGGQGTEAGHHHGKPSPQALHLQCALQARRAPGLKDLGDVVGGRTLV